MNIYEKILLSILILSNCVIAYNWVMYGVIESTLNQLAKRKIFIFVMLGIISFAVAGVLQRYGLVKIDLFTNQNNVSKSCLYLFSPALFLMGLLYLFNKNSGLLEFNRAVSAIRYWSLTNFDVGRVLIENGHLLQNFSRTHRALFYLGKSIEKQKKGESTCNHKTVVAINKLEIDSNGLYATSCPNCGFTIKVSDSKIDSTCRCHMCNVFVITKTFGGNMCMSTYGNSTLRRGLSVMNKKNLASAYSEKALLLRMMNSFEEATESADEALRYLDKIPSSNVDRDIIMMRSVATFRKAEIAHVQGDRELALSLYNECLRLDESIGNREDLYMIHYLMDNV